MEPNGRINVAVVYHYWALYREAIALKMVSQGFPLPRYTLFSGLTSEISIAKIDPVKANISIDDGGLRWRFLKNRWILGPFLWQSGVVKLAWKKEFNVIIFLGSMYHLSTWVGALIARIRGKRVLMWTHGFYEHEKGIKGRIRKLFYKMANGILLYGTYAKGIMLKYGFDQKKLYVVYNSLDYGAQLDVRRQIESQEGSKGDGFLFKNKNPTIIFIGRLTRQKKLEELIKALYLLKKEGSCFNLLFVGDGEERKNLEGLVDSYSINKNVEFYGECHSEEVIGPLIYNSSLCVSPGEVGLTAMHCLAYGTPVITHNNFEKQMPEFEAISHGKTGAFFQENNVDDLKNMIREWFESNADRNEVRKRCYEVIDKYYNPSFQLKVFNSAVSGDRFI